MFLKGLLWEIIWQQECIERVEQWTCIELWLL